MYITENSVLTHMNVVFYARTEKTFRQGQQKDNSGKRNKATKKGGKRDVQMIQIKFNIRIREKQKRTFIVKSSQGQFTQLIRYANLSFTRPIT